jgi:O-antigen ligase
MLRFPASSYPGVATPLWHGWSLLCLGLMLVLPFLARAQAPPTPSFLAEIIAAGFGLLACVSLAALGTRMAFPRSALVFPAFALLIVVQMSLGWLAFPQQGLLAVLYLAWAAVLCVLAATLRREIGLERVVAALAWFLALGTVLNCAVGLAQQFESYGPFGRYVLAASKDRVWGNLAQPNHLADYLSLGLASVGFLFATRRLHALLAALIATVAVYVLIQTGTRAVLLYLGAMLAGAAWIAWHRPDPAHRRLVAFVVLCLGAYVLLPPLLRELAPGSLGVSGAWGRWRADALTHDLRGRLWSAAWHMFMQAPWLGHGLREYAHQYFQINPHLPPRAVGGFHDHAHNLPLHVMAEFGMVGLTVLLLATLAWMRGLMRLPAGAAAWWVAALAAVLALHSLLEYPLWYAFFLGPAALILGLGDGRTVEFKADHGGAGRWRWYVLAGLALGAIALGQLVRDYLMLESFAAFRHRYLHATEAENRRAGELLMDVHRTSLLAPLVELGLSRSIRIEPERLDEKLLVNGRAMRVFPVDDVVYRQAMLLALHGDLPAATAQWGAALAAFPATALEAREVLRGRVDEGVAALAPLLEFADAAAAPVPVPVTDPSTAKE